MKNLLLLLTIGLALSVLFSCSDEKSNEDNNKEPNKQQEQNEQQEQISETEDHESCIETLSSYKQAVKNSVELIEKLIVSDKMSLEDNLEILQKAISLQQELTSLGQKNLGENCWQDFLKLQLRFVEALLSAQDKLAEGDVLSTMIENMDNIKDAKQAIEDIKALITE
jgi:hemolysin activation/secretion protein